MVVAARGGNSEAEKLICAYFSDASEATRSFRQGATGNPGPNPHARRAQFPFSVQADLGCPVPAEKIFRFLIR
jgi:hypothetical protein